MWPSGAKEEPAERECKFTGLRRRAVTHDPESREPAERDNASLLGRGVDSVHGDRRSSPNPTSAPERRGLKTLYLLRKSQPRESVSPTVSGTLPSPLSRRRVTSDASSESGCSCVASSSPAKHSSSTKEDTRSEERRVFFSPGD